MGLEWSRHTWRSTEQNLKHKTMKHDHEMPVKAKILCVTE